MSNRGFTIAALIVFTLGIGATTAIFSVVDAVVLRGLPFDEQHRLVALGQRPAVTPTSGALSRDPARLMFVAPQNYRDWVAQQQVFEGMAAIASGWLTLRLPGVEPESLVPQRVTADFFKVLRVSPALGRAFTVENEAAAADRVALLSDALWRRRFGGDPHIVGRIIALELLEGGRGADEAGYEVIGVMPAVFRWCRPRRTWIRSPPRSSVRIRCGTGTAGSAFDRSSITACCWPGQRSANAISPCVQPWARAGRGWYGSC